jgi:glutaredoxin
MLILYTKNNCEYCDKVKKVFAERGVVYEERNIKEPEYLKEAQAHNARTLLITPVSIVFRYPYFNYKNKNRANISVAQFVGSF